MSIDIEVGVTTSPNNKVDKDFTNVKSVSGVLIHPCTIDAPVIKIAGGYINANFLKGLFNRNYYIESQTLDKGFNYLHCISDPVSSFPQYGTTQYVARSETDYNLMIPDSLLPIETNEIPAIEGFGRSDIKSTESYVIGLTKCKNVNTLTSGITYDTRDLVTNPNDPNDTPHVE